MPTWGAQWTATLTDLRTKRERQTTVSPTVAGLDVQAEDGEWQSWPWTRVQQGEGTGKHVEFVWDGQSIRVADTTIVDSIHRIAPQTRAQLKSHSTRKIGIILAGYAAAIIGAGIAAWFAIGWTGGWVASMAPRTWEKRIGEIAIRDFAPADSVCGDRELFIALQSISGRLASTLPAEDSTFDIRVVDRPVLNAVTLPGGYIIVYRGLLQSADTPEELAGVLAHEMQHAVQRHSMRALGREFALAAALGLLTGGSDAAAAQWAGALTGLKMQREDEFSADEGALRMLIAAQVGSGGFLSFFEKLSRSEGGAPWLEGALSSHPATAERIERVRAWRRDHQDVSRPVIQMDRWRHIRTRCR